MTTRSFIPLAFAVCGLVLQSSVALAGRRRAPQRAPERVDQVAYLEQLRVARPGLSANPDAAFRALMLKPKFRAALMSNRTTQPGEFSRATPGETPGIDERLGQWRTAHQQTQQAQRQRVAAGERLIVRPAAYDPNYFTGYVVGHPRFYEPDGLVWKVFADFHAFGDLTPRAHLDYMTRLADEGFRGDSKIPVSGRTIAAQYNNLIVHAVSKQDALIAERVALEMFGSKLDSIGRGFDVADDSRGTNAQPWARALLRGDLERLPAEARDFLGYQGYQ